MKFLDIGVLSERSGLPPSTLRYYEEVGLIESLARHGLRRQYGSETLTQLALISLGKTAGFSLGEMKKMFGKDGVLDLPRTALRARADKLDLQIRKLTTLRNALRHAAECPAENHMECPKFRRLLRVASHSRPEREHVTDPKF
ncbi:helix-turn-helix domain-containing protein [Mycoplana ramosa]|uniref:Helix-turn-helix domain-containing protein n=1 Tax=Mycoplana ramosa TaxID=40837 RepID=A0ABW3YXD7_MYCRA